MHTANTIHHIYIVQLTQLIRVMGVTEGNALEYESYVLPAAHWPSNN